MNRIRIPGIVNIFKVSQPEEIKFLAQDPRIDRKFDTRTCPANWVLLKRSLAVLSFEGRRFPTMTPRDVVQRQTNQENLRSALNQRIAAISAGPQELEALANWVRGAGAEPQIGILTQQLLGGLFSPAFEASEDSWTAAKVLVAAPRSWKLPVFWWLLSGKVKRAKRLLAGMVSGICQRSTLSALPCTTLLKVCATCECSTQTPPSGRLCCPQRSRVSVSLHR